MRAPRRWAALLMTAALLLSAAGCGFAKRPDGEGTPVSLYYEVRDAEQLRDVSTVVVAETRSIQVLSLWDFFDAYFAGPLSEDLMSPFPAGTKVLDIQYTGGVLTLTMSGAFFTMTGVEMSVADCCLANTVAAYTGRDSVILMDETGSINLEVSPERYVLENIVPDEISESFMVYFADENSRYLLSETRNTTLSRNDTEAAYVMRRLLEGPETEKLRSVMPQGSEVRSIDVTDGVCMLDLNDAFYDNRPENAYLNYMTVYGIVNTLTGLEDISTVQFLREGEIAERYGIFTLTQPLPRYSDCIGPVRTASGEVDVNIYVWSGENQAAFAMPCRVKQTISEPLAEAVTRKVLEFEPPPGFDNPVPYGTELLNISMSGSTCYIDLSEKFIPQEDTAEAERAAVWALVKALTDLDDISAVVLTIAGESSGLKYVDITEALRSDSIHMDPAGAE